MSPEDLDDPEQDEIDRLLDRADMDRKDKREQELLEEEGNGPR